MPLGLKFKDEHVKQYFIATFQTHYTQHMASGSLPNEPSHTNTQLSVMASL